MAQCHMPESAEAGTAEASRGAVASRETVKVEVDAYSIPESEVNTYIIHTWELIHTVIDRWKCIHHTTLGN